MQLLQLEFSENESQLKEPQSKLVSYVDHPFY